MKRKSAEGIRPDQRVAVAANEEFDLPGQSGGRHTGGWDAYEVWRTRVKSAVRKAAHSKEDRDSMR